MTQEQIIEGNKLIAEFMGFTDDYLEIRKGFTSGEVVKFINWHNSNK